MANLMKQTEERHSESRMRAIRTSGSMRGSLPGGHWPSRLSSRLGLPTLLIDVLDGACGWREVGRALDDLIKRLVDFVLEAEAAAHFLRVEFRAREVVHDLPVAVA